MRVLLISANIEKLPDPVAPLGLAYISSALKLRGHEVQCLDLCFEENIEEVLKRSLWNFLPEVIGIKGPLWEHMKIMRPRQGARKEPRV
ncbi:MAG: cobalamin B12-binding domain-containing protein [Deltaproteobacteria bacterium]|nr:cobalamin B12-binding domain-containing protein [Deltaproteobacteria bacterium]